MTVLYADLLIGNAPVNTNTFTTNNVSVPAKALILFSFVPSLASGATTPMVPTSVTSTLGTLSLVDSAIYSGSSNGMYIYAFQNDDTPRTGSFSVTYPQTMTSSPMPYAITGVSGHDVSVGVRQTAKVTASIGANTGYNLTLPGSIAGTESVTLAFSHGNPDTSDTSGAQLMAPSNTASGYNFVSFGVKNSTVVNLKHNGGFSSPTAAIALELKDGGVTAGTNTINNSDGSWTVPAGVNVLKMTLYGPGGSGGLRSTSGVTGGGGSGAKTIKYMPVTPGQVYAYYSVVNNGDTVVRLNNVSGAVQAYAGAGSNVLNNTTTGGNPGTFTSYGNDVGWSGYYGGNGAGSGTSGTAGYGAQSWLGGGATSWSGVTGNGINANNYGGGGSGCRRGSSGTYYGGGGGGGRIEMEYLAIPATPVSAPSSAPTLSISASSGQGVFTLSWNAISGATNYRVFRDGVEIAFPSSTSYQHSETSADGTYTYTVKAYNSGGTGPVSNEVTYAKDTTVTAPTVSASPTGDVTTNAMTISRNSNSDVASWDLSRANPNGTNTSVATNISGSTLSYADTLPANTYGSYSHTITVRDTAGNTNQTTRSFNYIPSSPTPSVVRLNASQVTLSWTTVSGSNIAYRYKYGTDPTLNTLTGGGVSSWTSATSVNISVTPGTTYYFAVQAQGGANGIVNGPYSSPVSFTLINAPATPTGLAGTVGSTSIALSWSASSGATSYSLRRDGVEVYNGSGTSYSDSPSYGAHTYDVAASSANGTSAYSSTISKTLVDVRPGFTPTGLAGTVGATSIALSWNASSNATSYSLRRDGVEVYNGTGTSYSDSPSYGAHTYDVSASNTYGSEGYSSTISKTLVDVRPGFVPTGLAGTVGATSIALSWNSSANATSYTLRRDGVAVYTGSGTSYSDSPSYGAHTYDVSASNAYGSAGYSSTISKTLLDVTPPSVPNLEATPGTNQVYLAWLSSSGDAVEYELKRDGTLRYNGPGISYTDYISEGNYSYTVRAKDAAGNWSAVATASATVEDSTPPAVPTGLTVVTTGDKTATVSWDPAEGVEGYEIRRDGFLIASKNGDVSEFKYTFNTYGTFNFKIRAVDGAGNWSAYSSDVSYKAEQVKAGLFRQPLGEPTLEQRISDDPGDEFRRLSRDDM